MSTFWIAGVLVLGLIVKTTLSWLVLRYLITTYIIADREDRALAGMEKLLKAGYGVTSDPLGEFVKDKSKIISVINDYHRHIVNLGSLKKRYPDKEVSLALKPSRIGGELSVSHLFNYARHLCSLALVHGVFVWFDAEKLKDRKLTLDALILLSKKRKNFGIAIQSTHSDSLTILSRFTGSGIPVRIVKGAYKDGDLKDKEAVRKNFLLLYRHAKSGYAQAGKIAFGTCDKELLDRVVDLAIKHQFLFGVRTNLQEEYLAGGRNVLIYAPWGTFKQAWGFFLRRLREGIQFGMLLNFVRNIFEARRFRKKYGI